MTWSIQGRIEPEATITFLPETEVIATTKAHGAMPSHRPRAKLRNTGPRTGFDALLSRHELTDPPLTAMSLASSGAKTSDHQLAPSSVGLRATALGLRSTPDYTARFVSAVGTALDGLFRFRVQVQPTDPAPAPATGG